MYFLAERDAATKDRAVQELLKLSGVLVHEEETERILIFKEKHANFVHHENKFRFTTLAYATLRSLVAGLTYLQVVGDVVPVGDVPDPGERNGLRELLREGW